MFSFLYFDLLCKRFSSPPCIGLAAVALFIKQGESLFHEKDMAGLICGISISNRQKREQEIGLELDAIELIPPIAAWLCVQNNIWRLCAEWSL
jgi:hypothetical protein